MSRSSRIDFMSFQQGLGKALSRDDPVKWNQAWDKHLETKFDILGRMREIPDLYPEVDLASDYITSQSMISVVHSANQDLCELQHDLAKFVAEKRAKDNFDAKWLKMSSQEQEAYMIEGLLISCAAVVDMEDRRENCPETTMKKLQRDGGRGFLDLLTTFCPPNVSVERASEPIILSHPIYDKVNRIGAPSLGGPNSARSIMQRYQLNSRNFFLVFFLWNTMLNVYGKSQNYGAGRVGHDKDDMRAMKEAFRGTPLQSVVKETIKEGREARATADYHCVNCKKPRAAISGRMFCCTECKKVGREVWYCGKECQREDWKNGAPPHKQSCAKNLQFSGHVQTTSMQRSTASTTDSQSDDPTGSTESDDEFPPPVGGFRWTPALEHQISLLRENPNVDYVLVEPGSRPDQGVQVEHPMGQMMFRMSRMKAIQTGEPKYVAMMYKFLLGSARAGGFTPARLLLQLSKEYAVSVDVLSKMAEKKDDEESRSAQRRIDKMAEDLDKKLGIR